MSESTTRKADTSADAPDDLGFGLPDIAAAAKGLWWLVLIRGIVAVIFGVLALLFPGAALVGLTIVFAVYAIVDGAVTIGQAIRVRRTSKRWGWLLVQGILTLLAGIAAAVFPILAGTLGALVLLWVIVFWSLISGVAGIPAANAMSGDTGRKAWAYVASILSIVFGIALLILVIAAPFTAVLSLIWVVGAYAIAFGGLLIGLAITARSGAKAVASDAAS